jgi:hypothetical protein
MMAEAPVSVRNASVGRPREFRSNLLLEAELRFGETAKDLANRIIYFKFNEAYHMANDEGAVRASLADNETKLRELPSDAALERLASDALEALAITTPAAMRNQVGMLIGCFPNASLPNPEVFASTLIYDLLDLRISDAAFELACREIRRTQKFLPAISEIIEQVKRTESMWRLIIRMPQEVAKVKSRLEEHIKGACVQIEGLRKHAENRLLELPLDQAGCKSSGNLSNHDSHSTTSQPGQPGKPSRPLCLPTLAAAWKDDTGMLDLLRRADFEVQVNASAMLVTKGEPLTRKWLVGKLGGRH